MRTRRCILAILAVCFAVMLSGNTWLTSFHPALAAGTAAGYWKFDEGSGTTVADSSGHGYTGTLQGHATWAAGQVGPSSLSLNGSGGTFVDVPAPVVNIAQSYSVATWVKLASTSGYQTFVSIDGSQVSGFYLQLRGDTGKFAFTRLVSDSASAAASYASAASAASTGVWYHLLGVYDASAQTLSLYVNGTLQQTVSYTSPWQATGHTEIGRGKFGGNPVDFVNGQIDDVHMYSSALTTQDAQDLSALGYWKFDEGSGTIATDSSPNGVAGTINGATWTAGKINGALHFNGSSDSVNMGNQSSLNFAAGNFAVAAWFNTSSHQASQRIVGKGYSNWSDGYFLGMAAGAVSGGVGAGGTETSSLLFHTTRSFNDGKWHQATLVIDRTANTAQLYIDGQAQRVDTQPGTCGLAAGDLIRISGCVSLNASSSDSFSVGSAGGSADFFNGTLDEVRSYPFALSPSAIAILNNNLATTLTIQANQSGAQINPALYGLMFEDISHSGDGGIYAELIRNSIFKDDPNTPVDWSVVASSGAQGSIALDSTHQVNTTALTTSLKLQIASVAAGQRVGVANTGYWGIAVRPHTVYNASFYAQASADFSGPLTVAIESNDGATTYATATVSAIGTGWQKYTVKLTTGNVTASETNRFVISAAHTGTVWFNKVSLFPPTWNERLNGNRSDLMEWLNAMHPGFLRFPGGNFLEGTTLTDYFAWKKTIGDVSQRPGHSDPWGYRSSDGLGLLEYLEWCQDLHMQPLLAVYAGYALNGTHTAVGTPQFNALIQDALDEIQYATGSTNTTWGAMRAANGHPAPFSGLQYVEIGNEDWFDSSGSYNARYAAFYDAIKATYPQLKLIATANVTSRPMDVSDEHFYASAQWFESNSTRYDTYSRTGPKIFVGEYATQEGQPTPDLNAALGDAAWMTGLERNADIVSMASYAPLLVNVNAVNWGTNLIGYDALNSYASPSYYVQKLFSLYHGNVVLPGQIVGGTGTLYYVVSKVTSNGTIYIKAVNTSGSAQNVHLVLKGVDSLDDHGTATVLSSGSVTDTNTLSDPSKVVPVVSALNNLQPSFSYSFAPYSVTVLQLKVR